MIVNFKGKLVKKVQKTKNDGSPSKIFTLTFDVNGEPITLDGFGDNATIGAEYDSISLEIKDREGTGNYAGRIFTNLFVRNIANPSFIPDKEPNYEQPAEIKSEPEGSDDLPF